MVAATPPPPPFLWCPQEVDDIFHKYGEIKRISIKPGQAGGMPAFCFVEFGHTDDAYDAVKGVDGREKLGKRLRVSGLT